MNLSGKKLTTAILAGLMGATMFGGSVFADTTLDAVQTLANQNSDKITDLTVRVSNLETASSDATQNTKDIAANKTAIDKNAGDIATNKDNIAANKTAIDKNAGDIATNKDNIAANKTAIDKNAGDIANVSSTVTALQKDSATVKDAAKLINDNKGAIEKVGNYENRLTTVENISNNHAAAIGSDTNGTAVKKGTFVSALSQNTEDPSKSVTIGTNLNALDKGISDEISNRENGDKQLDDRITSVKDYLQNETEKNYVSKNMYNEETSVAEGAFVKGKQTVGQNLNAVDKGLNDEIAARIGADAAQDKVIKQVNDNLVSSVNTINKNVADGFNALSAADLKEAQTRAAADKKLQGNIDTEAQTREAADKKLQGNIDTEAQTRADADKKLQKNIAAEAVARDKADQKEAATRQAADQNLQNQINNNSTSINDLYGRYSSLKTDINKVGARSAALAGLHPLDFDPANKLNFAVASGSFKGENSVALGAFYRPNENVMFSAASTMGDSDNAYTFGLSFKIGPSSAKTKTTSPDAEELYKVVGELQDQLAAQQKEIEQLKADKAK